MVPLWQLYLQHGLTLQWRWILTYVWLFVQQGFLLAKCHVPLQPPPLYPSISACDANDQMGSGGRWRRWGSDQWKGKASSWGGRGGMDWIGTNVPCHSDKENNEAKRGRSCNLEHVRGGREHQMWQSMCRREEHNSWKWKYKRKKSHLNKDAGK